MTVGRIVDIRLRAEEAAVVALIAEGNAAIYPDPVKSMRRAREVAAEYIARASLSLWGMVRQNSIEGIIGVERLTDGEVAILDLAISPENRRQGTGRALIDFVRSELKPRVLWGYTSPDAADFYERCGFSVQENGSLPSGRPRYRFELTELALPKM